MRDDTIDKWVTHVLGLGIAAILILIPFHATLTVWLAQVTNHYTALRLWKEGILIVLMLGVGYRLVKDARLRQALKKSHILWLIIAYIVVQVVWGAVSYTKHQVSPTALGYGLIINTRFLIFFIVVWVTGVTIQQLRTEWSKLIFWPAGIVIMFGLMQYFLLPYDFLSHLGYNANTIFPYEDINHNIHYIRIMSTLRGANPLGAYLILIGGLAIALWQKKHSWWLIGITIGSLAALILSFSRGAWIGFGTTAMVLAWTSIKSPRARKIAGGVTGALTILAIIGVTALHTNATFQNIFFHTEAHSTIKTTSNQGHASALQNGLHDIVHEPLGRGPGTAGPASAYNTGHPERLAEDYFIQIAQETGWIGITLFGGINVLIAIALWRQKNQALAVGLCASLVGISVANFFSHAWSDDTLAYLWWGLAGIALSPAILQAKAEQEKWAQKKANA